MFRRILVDSFRTMEFFPLKIFTSVPFNRPNTSTPALFCHILGLLILISSTCYRKLHNKAKRSENAPNNQIESHTKSLSYPFTVVETTLSTSKIIEFHKMHTFYEKLPLFLSTTKNYHVFRGRKQLLFAS